MKIKTELPWLVRLSAGTAVLVLASVAVLWAYGVGRQPATPEAIASKEELEKYREQVAQLSAERDRYSATANAAESQINMERSAQKQLAVQIKSLEAENAALKEDLAFFESLLPNAVGTQGISIRRIKFDQIAPNQLRYRLLIMQGGKGEQTFIGNLQLVISILQGDKSAMITFPDSSAAEQEKFKLRFKYYQRVEGVLTLPEGASVRTVQARVLEKGMVRAQQATNL